MEKTAFSRTMEITSNANQNTYSRARFTLFIKYLRPDRSQHMGQLIFAENVKPRYIQHTPKYLHSRREILMVKPLKACRRGIDN